MDGIIKANIIWAKNKDLAHINLMMAKFMKENGKMGNKMGREN